jgi:hypothetical protein
MIRPTLEAVRRAEIFEEAVKGLDETNALYEAGRRRHQVRSRQTAAHERGSRLL